MLKMSKWVTEEDELMDLGIRVLKLPENEIRAIQYDSRNNSIQMAARKVLSKWRTQQPSKQEAYSTLYMGLGRCEKNQWAAKLKELSAEAEITTQGQPLSEKGQ